MRNQTIFAITGLSILISLVSVPSLWILKVFGVITISWLKTFVPIGIAGLILFIMILIYFVNQIYKDRRNRRLFDMYTQNKPGGVNQERYPIRKKDDL